MRRRSNSLPVLCIPAVTRTLESRRNGLGNIFQGQKSREIQNVTERRNFKRSLSTCGDNCTPVGQSIRYNLTSCDFEISDEVFEQSEDESCRDRYYGTCLDGVYPLLSGHDCHPETSLGGSTDVYRLTTNQLDQTGFNTRRFALADIFENVQQDLLLELLALYSRTKLNDFEQYKNRRRNGLADVHENINLEELKMFIRGFEEDMLNGYGSDSDYSSDETEEATQPVEAYRRNRRNALADIYDGVESGAIQTIAGELDEIEEEAKTFDYQSRRMGHANIKDCVSNSDISRLKDTYSENEESAKNVTRCHERRSALADIYCELDKEERESFLKRFAHSVDSDSE